MQTKPQQMTAPLDKIIGIAYESKRICEAFGATEEAKAFGAVLESARNLEPATYGTKSFDKAFFELNEAVHNAFNCAKNVYTQEKADSLQSPLMTIKRIAF